MQNLVNRDIKIDSSLFSAHIFWARVVNSESDSWMTDKTRHSFWEAQLALEGEIEICLSDDRILCIRQNEFAVIPANEYHYISKDENNCIRFIMAFSIIEKNSEIKRTMQRLSELHSHTITEEMNCFLHLLLQPPSSNNDILHKRRLLAFEGFLLEILQCFSPVIPNETNLLNKESINDLRVEQVLQAVKMCNGIGITPSELAELSNLSARHLNRLLVSYTGHNLHELINSEKLKMIENLLSSTNLSLGEIAGICDFADEYGMNKFFKRYNLISPSKYRHLTSGKRKN